MKARESPKFISPKLGWLWGDFAIYPVGNYQGTQLRNYYSRVTLNDWDYERRPQNPVKFNATSESKMNSRTPLIGGYK